MKFWGNLKLTSYLWLVASETALAALWESIDYLPTDHYDFIVVGGGVAGNVIGNRLTEDGWTVLVIESGPSNEGVLEPPLLPVLGYFAGNSPILPYDWNSTTVPQEELFQRSIFYPRGHILGGGSSTNGMYYARGSSSDWNRYADVVRDPGWSWEAIQPYIRKNERWTEPVDDHNTTGQYNPAYHSTTGINAVSLYGWPQGLDPLVVQTMDELPKEFPFVLDYNGGKPLGLGYLQMTVNRGKRSSSATSYLAPQFLNRPNLDVVVNTQVLHVLTTGTTAGKPHFGAVDVSRADGLRRRLYASNEVILSAGVIGTPQLLLLSGIGDPTELRAVGVEPVLSLPDVGKNFSDHPLVTLTWHVDTGLTMDNIKNIPSLYDLFMREWESTNTGPFAAIANSFVNWARLPANAPIFNTFSDPASGPNSPHYGQYPLNGGTYPGGQYLTVLSLLLTPLSRGTVSLRSANPYAQPLINPRYMSSKFDLEATIEAVRNSQRFVAAPTWRFYVTRPVAGQENLNTDHEIAQFILRTMQSGIHGVGTASMSARDANHGVVDPDLRVKGAFGLRVVDASVLPYVPAAHTQTPVYILAERAADLIKRDWPGRFEAKTQATLFNLQ